MGIHFEKSRSKYTAYTQRKINGVTHNFRQRFNDQYKAESWLAEKEQYLYRLEGTSPKTAPNHSRGELVHSPDPLFIDACENYINTVALRYRSYKQDNGSLFRRTQKHIGSCIKLSEITTPYLTDYAYKRHDQDGVTVTTVKRELHAIKQVLQFSKKHYAWQPDFRNWPLDPDIPIDNRYDSEKRGLRDTAPLPPLQFKKLLEWLRRRDFDVHLAMIVLYETSMRRGEVIRLKKNFVSLKEPAFVCIPDIEHKNKKPKVVMLTPLAANAIELLMKRESDDGRVFQFGPKTDKGKGAYILRLFKQAATEVLGRPFLIIHQLRKENASQQRMRGIDDDIRQRQTGHIDKSVMDQVYTLLPPEFRAQFYRESFLGVDKVVNI